MPAGLFELRKDPITGWWVATVVDRAFHRERFALAAEPSLTAPIARTAASRRAMASGCGSSRTMRSMWSATEEDARGLERGLAQVALGQSRASGSWRTIVAPPGEHRPLHAVGSEIIVELLTRCRER